jgi:hypothetical protein
VTPPGGDGHEVVTATVAADEWGVAEPEAFDQRRPRRGDVVHGDDDVVDARRDRVERRRRLAGGRGLLRRRIGPGAGDLDPVCLGEQDAEQLLGEVRVDAGLDRLLAACREDVTDPPRLDHRRVAVALDVGDLTAHGEPLGDDVDQRAVELVDARPERVEVGHGWHGNR